MPNLSCYLMGGLGNQLFQIFATIAHGIKYQYKVIFPYSEVLTVGTIRTTYWDLFLKNIQFMLTKNSKIKNQNQFNIEARSTNRKINKKAMQFLKDVIDTCDVILGEGMSPSS